MTNDIGRRIAGMMTGKLLRKYSSRGEDNKWQNFM
jgi:hypothetical protein